MHIASYDRIVVAVGADVKLQSPAGRIGEDMKLLLRAQIPDFCGTIVAAGGKVMG